MKKWLGFLMAAAMLVTAFMILPIHGEAELYDNVIRLHVLANSDSEEDQALKLLVRDAVVEKTKTIFKNVDNRKQAEAILRQNLPVIEQTARDALRAAGAENTLTVELGQESYPTREYERLAFPAGEYLSLRVMIGEAEGKNWWCVLFPPLCRSAATSREEAEMAFLAAGLTGEQYRIITDSDENTKYKLRFKLLEVAESIFRE
ncbi:MAG: stage II sporulation protein R [Clostridia bacterium]|nr:stage II sporulation protein R [Clostridia bacterium]